MNEFPQSVIEKVGHYVYTLADPPSGKVFYVGKGQGNRVFAHAQEALPIQAQRTSWSGIRRIKASGAAVQYMIVRHGMTASAALEVESALIDFIGLSDLDNYGACVSAKNSISGKSSRSAISPRAVSTEA